MQVKFLLLFLVASFFAEGSFLFSKRAQLEGKQKAYLKQIYKAYKISFKEKDPLEKWPGVKVNEEGYVVSLKFSFKSFDKPLHPSFLKFTELEKLKLHSCGITGEVPKNISDLSKLKILDLSNNKLVGKVPFQIGSLSKLEKLSLYRNELTLLPGTIASLKNLKELYVFHNKLTKIPKRIKQLHSLEKVSFTQNQIKHRLKIKRRIKKANPNAEVVSGDQGEAPFYMSLWWSLW